MPDNLPNKNETFGNRPRATEAMRHRATLMEEKASRLMKEALSWRHLAAALDEIEKYAGKQSVEGSEGGPHIGVGSVAENLLWKLANDYQEKLL